MKHRLLKTQIQGTKWFLYFVPVLCLDHDSLVESVGRILGSLFPGSLFSRQIYHNTADQAGRNRFGSTRLGSGPSKSLRFEKEMLRLVFRKVFVSKSLRFEKYIKSSFRKRNAASFRKRHKQPSSHILRVQRVGGWQNNNKNTVSVCPYVQQINKHKQNNNNKEQLWAFAPMYKTTTISNTQI